MKTGGTGDLRETVANIYGANVARDVFAVTADQDGISLEGYVGKPSVLKSNRNWQTCIVNHRIVHNPLMFKAIDNAYHAMLPKSGYPFAMLHLHVDPATIDVNVHPAKTEIKFSDEQAVYRAIYHSIVTALVAQEKPEAIAKTIGEVGAAPQPEAHVGAPTWGARSQECGQAPPVGAVPKGPQRTAPAGLSVWAAGPQEKATSQSAARTAPLSGEPLADGSDRAQKGLSGEPVGTHGLDSDGSSLSGRTPQSAELTAPLRRGANVGAESLPCEGEGDRLRWKGSSLFSQALAQHGQGGPSEATSVVSEASAPKIVFDGDDDVFIPLGEVADCFIIAKKGQDLYIVDQHAAHERIRYDTFCKRVERMPSQQLLTPEFVEVDNEDMTLLLERQDVFNDLGYTYSEAGPTTLRVEEVPCDLQTSDIADSLKDICLLLHDQKEPDKAMVRHRSLAYLSCHGAVKAGDSLNIRQMKQLLDDLFHTEKPYVCPHGRPTIIRFTPKELAHLFKRT